jgi:hypothetical protein
VRAVLDILLVLAAVFASTGRQRLEKAMSWNMLSRTCRSHQLWK